MSTVMRKDEIKEIWLWLIIGCFYWLARKFMQTKRHIIARTENRRLWPSDSNQNGNQVNQQLFIVVQTERMPQFIVYAAHALFRWTSVAHVAQDGTAPSVALVCAYERLSNEIGFDGFSKSSHAVSAIAGWQRRNATSQRQQMLHHCAQNRCHACTLARTDSYNIIIETYIW